MLLLPIVEISYDITLQCVYHLTLRQHYLEKQKSIRITFLVRLNRYDGGQLGEYKLRVLGYRRHWERNSPVSRIASDFACNFKVGVC